MLKTELCRKLIKARSLDAFITKELQTEASENSKAEVIEDFVRLRSKHDFPFWVAMYAYIKRKGEVRTCSLG